MRQTKDKNAKNSEKATCSISWICFYTREEEEKLLAGELLVTLTIVSHISLPIIITRPNWGKTCQSRSQAISDFVSTKNFPSIRREKIIISNHVVFLCEEILECLFIERKNKGRGRENSASASLNGLFLQASTLDSRERKAKMK